MSAIDQRIVEMKFNNSDFERNIRTSQESLNNFKQNLDFSGATKGFDEISKSANSLDFSGLSTAAGAVGGSFNMLQEIAVGACRQIGVSIANLITGELAKLKNFMSSLTTDQIGAGFAEYELKMGSIQTIMAGTGESLETVNGYLDELNTYSDKTIYSFSDMTSNIGKFTNAGVKLDDAVKAIQGVANVAAVSGANTNEASRAMYNFSQALSSGAVKLIDWKSIENANMATVEFKQQLMDTAVVMGTLIKTEEGYKSTTTDAQGKVSDLFTSTFNFNNALSAQWMTTEVLTQTLANYSEDLQSMTEEEKAAWKEKMIGIGYTEEQIAGIEELNKKAYASATEIKTWSMLVDTLRESVGSGWARTWEIIFGDFNAAKKLWTELGNIFGEVIGKSADARNGILETWSRMGGRNLLIESAMNVVDALVSIVAPIKTAFENIFPPLTGQILFNLTRHLRDFTEGLILSDVAAAKVKFAFQGLFSLFDIGKQIVSAILLVFEPFESVFSKIGTAVLHASVRFGVWITEFDKYAKETDLFANAVKTAMDWVHEKITWVIDKVKEFKPAFDDAIEKVKEFWSELSSKSEEVSSGALVTVKDIVFKIKDGVIHLSKNLGELKQAFVDAFGWIGEKISLIDFSKGLEVLGAVASAVGEVLKVVSGIFKDFFNGLLENAGNGNFQGVLDLINTGLFGALLIGIKKFIGNGADILDSVNDALEGLGGVLEGYQNKLNAEALISIAGAVGILAASLLVISTIDSAALTSSIAAIGGLMTMLALFTKGTAASTEQKGLAGALGLSGIVEAKQFDTMAKGLEKVAIAVGILAASMLVLSTIDSEGIAKGLISIGTLLTMLGAYQKIMQNDSMVKGSAGLIAVSASILILSTAMKNISDLNWDQIGQGLVVIGVLVGYMSALIAISSGFQGSMIGVGIGLIAVAASMLILSDALKSFSEMTWEQIAAGLVTMGVALAEITAALRLMPNGAMMVLMGVGLIAVSAAMLILSQALKAMGEMKVGELVQGLIGLGVVLTELAIGLTAMVAALPGAAALAVAAAALLLLVPAIQGLAGMTISELATGLGALAIALGVFLVAGTLAVAVAPGLVALAVGMLAVSAAVIGFGAGIALISVGLAALAVSITAVTTAMSVGGAVIISAITLIVEAFLSMLPRIVESLVSTFVLILETLANNSDSICQSLTTLLKNLIQMLVNLIPDVLNLISVLLQGILDFLEEFVPKVLKLIAKFLDNIVVELLGFLDRTTTSLLQFVSDFLDKLALFIKDVFEDVLNLMLDLLDMIEEKLPEFIQRGVDIIIALIKGIADAQLDLINAGIETIIALINGLADSIRTNTPLMIDAIDNLMDAVIEAIFLYLTHFVTKGGEIVGSIITGVINLGGDLVTTFIELLGDVIEAIRQKIDDFIDIGKDLITGFIGGIKDTISNVVDAGEEIVDAIVDTVTNGFDIGSPSKVMKKIGGFVMQGLEIGMEDEEANVIKSAKETTGAIEKVISDMADFMDIDMNLSPVIKPELDMSDVERRASEVGNLFETSRIQASGTIQNGSANGISGDATAVGTSYTFTQNNYSPKALSRLEIYRQTKNQFALMREVVNA